MISLLPSWQGALTHGDRRAGDTRDLSKFNIDNKVRVEWSVAREGLHLTMEHLM